MNHYNDDSGRSKQIYVWGMHYNEVGVGNGIGSEDEVRVDVRDYDYFNIKNSKTRKPNVTDEQKTFHYKKSKSKILPRIDTSKSGRSKRSEDRLISMGYTCEQIGGCYYQ